MMIPPPEKPEKITNYRKLALSNVPLRSPDTELQCHLFSDFDKSAINWNHVQRETHKNSQVCLVFLTFLNPQLCRLAKRIVNLTNYRGIVADFALDYPKHAPKSAMKQLVSGNDDQVGNCAQCESESSNLACSKCLTESTATFYCNSTCQSLHWDIHRWECHELPKLIESSDIEEHLESKKKEKVQNFMPKIATNPLKVGDFVIVLHAESPREIYVRSAKTSEEEVSVAVGEHDLKNRTSLKEEPQVKNIKAYVHDGKCRRAQIVSIDAKGLCELFLIDLGETITEIHWRELKELSFIRRSVPRICQKLYLEGVGENLEIGGRLEEDFNSLINSKTCLRIESMERRKNPMQGKKTLVNLLRSNGNKVNDEIRQITSSNHVEELDEEDEDEEELDFDQLDDFTVVDSA